MFATNRTWLGRGVLFVALVLYTLLGAAIFQNLESELPIPEVLHHFHVDEMTANVSSLLELLMDITCKIPDKHERQAALFYLFIHAKAIFVADSFAKFGFSLYYCASVYTTIGYGDMTPVSKGGRFATIVYALFGIPLFLAVLGDTGRYLAYLCHQSWMMIRRVGKLLEGVKHNVFRGMRRVNPESTPPHSLKVKLSSRHNLQESLHSVHDPHPGTSSQDISPIPTSGEAPKPYEEKKANVNERLEPIEEDNNSEVEGKDGGCETPNKVFLHLCQSRSNLETEDNAVATIEVGSVREGEFTVTVKEPQPSRRGSMMDLTNIASSNLKIVVDNEPGGSVQKVQNQEIFKFHGVAVVLFAMYALLGAILFSYLEGWSYLNSVYFVVITLLTIGFGDLTPTTRTNAVISMAYNFLGLTLASMYLSLLQDRMHRAQRVLLFRVKGNHTK